jgi:hypothetical protein
VTDPKELAKSKRKLTRAGIRDAANVSFWGMGAYAIAQLIAMMFTRNLLGTAAIQSLVAELAAGKVGVAWSDPEAPIPSSSAIAKRAGRGAVAALVVAAICIVATLIRGGSITRGTFTIPSAALGLLTAALTAMRNELLLRGIVIRAFKHLLPLPVLLFVCALAGAAARFGDPDATPIELVASAAIAVIFASAWVVDRGAWLAWGAHAAWAWIVSTLARGVILDVKSPNGGPLDGDVAVVAVLVVTALIAARFSAMPSAPAKIPARSE